MIALLEPFKEVGEQIGKESDVTLSYIVPMFDHLKIHLSEQVENESPMITDMKKHMLDKLETRYDEEQMKFLKIVTYLDPRVKH